MVRFWETFVPPVRHAGNSIDLKIAPEGGGIPHDKGEIRPIVDA
jgi:hypothetical protein